MPPSPESITGDAEPLLALLTQCVVRVDVDGTFTGSGFFIAPGEVVTCAHVVHGAEKITVTTCSATTHSARVVSDLLPPGDPRARFYPLPDVALLHLTDPPTAHPCVQLDISEPVSTPRPDVLCLDAYTQGEHTPGSVVHSGAALEFERTVVEDGWRLYKLASGQVVGGFSGGPVLNRRTGGVCAVVDSTRSERSDLGGFGVPVPAVLAALPGVGERNAAFHATDRRWRQAWEDQNQRAAERAGRREALPLLEPVVELDWQPGDPPSDLLRPRYGVVPFVPRGELLPQIMRWREADERMRVLVLAGAGGLGKTRSAIEVCGQAQRSGWTSGLLGATEHTGSTNGLAELAGWPGRLVVAVDYAETRPELVTDLLWKLYRQRGRPACRVVLIVRQAHSRTELVDLFAQGEVREELTGLMRRAEVVRLSDRELELDRRELFTQALSAFATRLGAIPAAGRVDLRASHFDRPLFVLAAALLVATDPDLDVGGLGEDELFGEILHRHEAQYWNKWNTALGAGLHPDDQRLAVALAVLMGATTPQDADRLIRLLPGLHDAAAERSLAVARWLRRLYGSPEPTAGVMIRPLEPDLLAEALVAQVLTDRPELIGQALDAGSPAQLTRSLLVLSRVASHRDTTREPARDALDQRLASILDLLHSPDTPGDELITALRLAVAELRPIRGAINCADQLPTGGPAVTTLAIEIMALAIDGLRTLAEADPTRFLPDLAMSLNNQSTLLAEVGRPAEGLDPIEEAVSIRRALAQDDPTRFLPDLATSLNNQSNRRAEAGRPVEGLDPIQEAVTHYRALAQTNPTRFLPDLAASLTNQSVLLAEVGRPVEGLDSIEEAVSVRRALAQADPTRFLPDLAASLNNQSTRLAEVGRPVEGLDPIEEAVTHYRALAQADPTRFLPNLAASLNNQSTLLAEVGRRAEGLDLIEEAVGIRRALAQADPTRFLPNLAVSLNDQSTLLAEVGRPVEGLDLIEEAVGIRRALAQADPTRFLPNLAVSLNNQSTLLAEAGRPVEGLDPIEEAVTHYRALAQADPTRFLPNLAASLNNQSTLLAEVDRRDEAARQFADALDGVGRDGWSRGVVLLARARWHHSTDDLAAALADAWHAVALLGDSGDARRHGEARALLRSIRTTDPDRFDQVWHSEVGTAQPAWLRLLEPDATTEELLIEWINTTTWDESFAFLAAHASALLTDPAEASLEHLIDHNPGNTTLTGHLDLLRAARTDGVEPVHAAVVEQQRINQLRHTLSSWISTSNWEDSARFLTEYADQLLTSDAEDALAALSGENPDEATLLAHHGLLSLARHHDIRTAYSLLEDPEALAAAVAPPPGAASSAELLAATRLDAGLHPDSGEAHLRRALTALEHGIPEEAEQAIHRCADNLASWERPAIHRRLTAAADTRPDLDVARIIRAFDNALTHGDEPETSPDPT